MCSSQYFSQKVFAGTGVTSANFLEENPTARHAGMGGLYTAITDGADSLNTNPAGLSLLKHPELNLSYLSSRNNSFFAFTGYAHPLLGSRFFKFVTGAGMVYYSAGNIDVNYANGTTASFNAEKSYAGTLSVSARVFDWLSLGISPKYLKSTLVEQFSGSAFAADIGGLFFPFPNYLKERIRLGAAVQNVGSKLTYKSTAYDLPRVESLGGSALIFDHEQYGSMLAGVQTEKSLGDKWRHRLGGEYALGIEETRIVFFRFGYQVSSDEDYSLGFGFREKGFRLDYAFVNSSVLEKTHRFTLAYQFGSEDSAEIDLEKEQAKSEPLKLIDLKSEKVSEKHDIDKAEIEEAGKQDLLKQEDEAHSEPHKDLQPEKESGLSLYHLYERELKRQKLEEKRNKSKD